MTMIQAYKILCRENQWISQPGYVVYLEKEFTPGINLTIHVNYKKLNYRCTQIDKTFIHFPQLLMDGGTELCQFMTGRNNYDLLKESSQLLKVLLDSDQQDQLQGPSILFTGSDSQGLCTLYKIPLPKQKLFHFNGEKFTQEFFEEHVLGEIFEDYIKTNKLRPSFPSIIETADDDGIRFRLQDDSEKSERPRYYLKEDTYAFDKIPLDSEERMICEKAKRLAETLLEKGYPEEIIFQLFRPLQKVSPMRITKNLRIILPEYNHMEIELSPILQAVYFLFLKHPEGINFKDMIDYKDELLSLYIRVAKRGSKERLEATVDELVNPLTNAMNEKCSRIKNVFRYNLDDHLAQYYYISGSKGEDKRIVLDRKLISGLNYLSEE